MIALCLLLQAPAREFARVEVLPMAEGQRAGALSLADLDGDGTREWLVATHQAGKDFARKLEVWRRGAANAPERIESLGLTPDVVAFAHGDVRPGGGEELLLFNAGGVFVWKFGAQAKPERLQTCELLWQAPDPHELHQWQAGLCDLDLDGLPDLVLPEPGGYQIVLQRRSPQADAPFGIASRLRLPVARVPSEGTGQNGPVAKRTDSSFSIRLDLSPDAEAEAGPTGMVAIDEQLPVPQWLDWNADGRLDLLLLQDQRLCIWVQALDGSFPAAAEHIEELPLGGDESREFDISYSSHAVELDRDGQADCVIFASDKRSEEVRTQALIHVQAKAQLDQPPFALLDTPTDLLVFAGFVSDPSFRDLDSDGYPELILRTVRPDLIDQLRSATTQSIDAELYVYRNRGGRFSRQPDLVRPHSIAMDDFETSLCFLGDLTGDGLSELLVRDSAKQLRLFLLRAQGQKDQSSWSVVEKPVWELQVDPRAELVFYEAYGKERAGLFIIEPTQILRVSFP